MFWGVFSVLLLLIGRLFAANLVNLQCWVTYALMNSNGASPLADGSIVLIIGSSNDTVDPMNTYGGTSYIARSTTGDDQIIGEVTVDSSELGSNGTFYSGDFYFDPDEVKYLYLRFWDSSGPLTGMLNWGESAITSAQNYAFGVLWLDFSPDADHIWATTNYDNFVIIPEPGSGGLVLLALGLLAGMVSASRGRNGAAETEGGRKEEHNRIVTDAENGCRM